MAAACQANIFPVVRSLPSTVVDGDTNLLVAPELVTLVALQSLCTMGLFVKQTLDTMMAGDRGNNSAYTDKAYMSTINNNSNNSNNNNRKAVTGVPVLKASSSSSKMTMTMDTDAETKGTTTGNSSNKMAIILDTDTKLERMAASNNNSSKEESAEAEEGIDVT